METYFSMNALFRAVETDFLFFQRLLSVKAFFPSSGDVVLNESFIPATGEGFPRGNHLTLIESFSASGNLH